MAVRQARAWFLLLLLGASCKPAQTSAREFALEREQMVKEQVAMRGVTDERVLRAMRKVPREQFVPEQILGQSYSDGPLPIGYDQTISQPFVVAFMCSLSVRLPGAAKPWRTKRTTFESCRSACSRSPI